MTEVICLMNKRASKEKFLISHNSVSLLKIFMAETNVFSEMKWHIMNRVSSGKSGHHYHLFIFISVSESLTLLSFNCMTYPLFKHWGSFGKAMLSLASVGYCQEVGSHPFTELASPEPPVCVSTHCQESSHLWHALCHPLQSLWFQNGFREMQFLGNHNWFPGTKILLAGM